MQNMDLADWPDLALCRCSPLVRAVVREASRANVGNLPDTSHSIRASPSAALAEDGKSDFAALENSA